MLTFTSNTAKHLCQPPWTPRCFYIAIHNDFCKYLTDRDTRTRGCPSLQARSLRLECRCSQSLWISLTVQPCKFTLFQLHRRTAFCQQFPPSASIPRLAGGKYSNTCNCGIFIMGNTFPDVRSSYPPGRGDP